jgi:hypothetical protein
MLVVSSFIVFYTWLSSGKGLSQKEGSRKATTDIVTAGSLSSSGMMVRSLVSLIDTEASRRPPIACEEARTFLYLIVAAVDNDATGSWSFDGRIGVIMVNDWAENVGRNYAGFVLDGFVVMRSIPCNARAIIIQVVHRSMIDVFGDHFERF